MDEVAKAGGTDLCLLLPYPTLSQERELCDPGVTLTCCVEVDGTEALLMLPPGLGLALMLTVEGEVIQTGRMQCSNGCAYLMTKTQSPTMH